MHDQRSIFWPVFWAVLAALAVMQVVKWAAAAVLAAGLLVGFHKLTGDAPAAAPGRVYQRPAQSAATPHWPGPSGALRAGMSRACIGGVEAERVNNGWRQLPNQPCIADTN